MFMYMIILLWCSSFTDAFTPSGFSFKIVRKRYPTSLCGIGDRDFQKIFGKQEAAERRIRDLAREYHPLPKSVVDELYSNADEEESSSECVNKPKNKQQQQQQQRRAEKTQGIETNDGKDKKYVPPPHL